MAAQTAGAELRGGELAGAGRLAATGARLGRGLVQKDELGMGSPLGYLGRWCGTGSMALDGEGGSAAHRREISHGAGTDRGKRRHGEFRYRGVKLWDHLAGEGRRRRAGAGAAELRAWRGHGGARGEGRRRRGLLASDLHERGLRLAAKPRRGLAWQEGHWRHGNSARAHRGGDPTSWRR